MESRNDTSFNCPMSRLDNDRIQLAHGGGGKMTHQLIDDVFRTAFDNLELETEHDGAILNIDVNKLAFTTDSYVVNPLFFPGGNIGLLAINGTVNDLAMCGARPLYLSAGFIIEEGFPVESLRRIVYSMRAAANIAGVKIVTGDTKVTDKGKGDGVYINTAGIGLIEHNLTIKPSSVKTGDIIILNGDIGRHGIAVLSQREGLSFETEIESDCAPLAESVMELLDSGVEIHCLRDLTRGGLATGLVEIAESADVRIKIDEQLIPVSNEVKAACEFLGFDPIYIANEGRFIAIVAREDSEKALTILGNHKSIGEPYIIGEITADNSGIVTLINKIGTERIIDMLSMEQLPRIC